MGRDGTMTHLLVGVFHIVHFLTGVTVCSGRLTFHSKVLFPSTSITLNCVIGRAMLLTPLMLFSGKNYSICKTLTRPFCVLFHR